MVTYIYTIFIILYINIYIERESISIIWDETGFIARTPTHGPMTWSGIVVSSISYFFCTK